MGIINVEIKARCEDQERIREILKSEGAYSRGTDRQIDTYFKINSGRLKLREGDIENNLIYYDRDDKEGPKQSDIVLYKPEPNSSLKELLEKSLGILTVVDKWRELYFIGNVKFHIDHVEGLGKFVEIEAIDHDGNIGKDKLFEQCQHYLDLFKISKADLVSGSYSDLLLNSIKK